MILICFNDNLLVKQMDDMKTLNDRSFSLVMEPVSERQSQPFFGKARGGTVRKRPTPLPSTDHTRAKPDTFTMPVDLITRKS